MDVLYALLAVGFVCFLIVLSALLDDPADHRPLRFAGPPPKRKQPKRHVGSNPPAPEPEG